MTTNPMNPVRSEKGIALVVVLLLLAVMTALTTGLTLNSQTEIAMASNELNYAGARAAAEAGMNRAIEQIIADTTTNLLATGAVPGIGNGPFTLGTDYRYSFQILDDDNPALYTTTLTSAQLTQMGENGNATSDANQRLILAATGFGPKGTTIQIRRMLVSQQTEVPPPVVPPPVGMNAAIIVDGDLQISGNPTVTGNNGSVQANDDLLINGSPTISQNAFASGTYTQTGSPTIGGAKGGGQAPITVPEVNAASFAYLATHRLTAGGDVILVSTGAVVTGTGWSFSSGEWQLAGNSATSGTYYAETNVKISGNVNGPLSGNGDPLDLSIIATGSIEVSGNPTLKPQNSALYQFITDGDLKLGGNLDIDPTTVEGQSLVRNQLMISGNPDIRGRIIVKDLPTTGFATNHVDSSIISGNPDIVYNGSFPALTGEPPPTPPSTITYTNNVLGWIES